MKELPALSAGSGLPSTIVRSAVGGVLGGSLAALVVIGFTEILKGMLAVVSGQHTWVLILAPLIGLALSVLVLYGFGLSGEMRVLSAPRGQASGEVLRLAPLARI